MDAPELAELLIHAGLIEACERDSESGEVLRYAETPMLFQSSNKELLVRTVLQRLAVPRE
jgi:hypothetical protein